MNDADRALLDRLLDDDLPPAEQTTLLERIAADPEGAAQLAERALLHAGLRRALRREALQHAALATVGGVAADAEEKVVVVPPARFRHAAWAAAAAVVILLAAGAAWWRSGAGPGRAEIATSVAARPYLAIVSDQSADARWSGTNAPGGTGHALAAGRYQLAQGSARLRLDNGVDLFVEGPAELELRSVAHGILHRGRISAHVPPQAIGFRLDAAALRVVDLGTAFGLVMDDTGRPRVHVFEGKVAASVASTPAGRVEIAEGQTVRLNPQSATLESARFDAAAFPRAPSVANSPQTDGNVRFLETAPASVRAGVFEHDYILVFPEQRDVVLPKTVPVTAAAPGEYPRPKGPPLPQGRLRAGTRVSSYLVHYDRPPRGARRSAGSITFDQPILGIIPSPRQLTDTDAWLGNPATVYEKSPERRIEINGPPEIVDRFTVGPDRRTLRLDWHVTALVDELRVLVAAPEPAPTSR